MSYTISDLMTYTPDGNFGTVSYLVTLDDGRAAWVWTGFNAAYSRDPSGAADGSTRATDSSGVYLGFTALDVAIAPVASWTSPPNGLNTNGDVAATGGFTLGMDTDPVALAAIAATASDPAVVAAISAALATGPAPLDFAVKIELTLFPNGSSTPTIPTIDAVDPQTSTPAVASGDWLTVAPLDPSGAVPGTPDYVSVTWESSDHSVLTLSAGAVLGPADTNLGVTISTVGSGSATITATVVSLAVATAMVLTCDVTVP